MRRSPIRRGKRLAVRRTAPRRVASPLPLPTGEPVRAEDVREPGVAFGPQSELCRRTTCAACWALSRRSPWWLIDWSQLPAAPEGRHSEAHHEPPRGLGVASEDDDTIPLCPHHHRTGPAFAVRHRMVAREFYSAVGIGDYLRVRDELRRRVQSWR